MSQPATSLPPHDPRDPTLIKIAHSVLSTDEELWRRCAFVGLRLLDGGLHEARQCPQCTTVVLRPTGFSEAARALAGRLATLGVPLSLSLAAQSLAEWASRTAPTPADGPPANSTVLMAPQDEALIVRIPIGTSLKEAERRLILAALASFQGSRSETAQALGLSRRTLYNKLASLRRRQASTEPPPCAPNQRPDVPDKLPHFARPHQQKRSKPQRHCEWIASHSKWKPRGSRRLPL